MTNAHEFTRRLQDLLARERVAMADFLLAVADFDRRALWLELGYASLFDYLHRELGLSKASTFLRTRAVGLIQKFPDVLDPLRDGRLCLSSMGELSKVLTPERAETRGSGRLRTCVEREAPDGGAGAAAAVGGTT